MDPTITAAKPTLPGASPSGALRKTWREIKKIPPIGLVWRGLRAEYFRVRALQQRISYLSRHREIRRQQWTKLQVGAGGNALPGWLNTDLRPSQQVLSVDVSRPLPFPAGEFTYVFSEHMIEHLTFEQGRRMLREIHRILADGGKVRVSTPDFDFFLTMFREEISSEEKDFIEWHVRTYTPNLPVHPLSVMNTMFRSWGHKHLYNQETLSSLLQDCGFSRIARYRTGESHDPELEGLESHGKLVGESHNRMETLVLEATKLPNSLKGVTRA
jgi:predicted SAM-dependent methyltransferase